VYRPEFAMTNQDEWLMSDDIDSTNPTFLKVNDSSGEQCRDHGDTTPIQREAIQIRAVSYSGWNQVCLVEQIPHNQGYPVRIGDREIALFRHGQQVFALDNVCPHLYYRLANGPQINGTVICPGHCLRFDLKNGRCLDEDSLGVKRHAVKRLGNRVLVKLVSD
jgi:3-phenylpropionate/trans-cinnamate dioxygenase ferredoxin subunit